jgi:transposase-like protein
MPKRQRRSFTAKFKAQVVLEVLSGYEEQGRGRSSAQAEARTHRRLEGDRP